MRSVSRHKFRDIYLILLCGLPGTGKTTVACKLERALNYVVVDQNEIRRQHGYRKMPKTFDPILREIDRFIAVNLISDRGVIFDSVNRRTARRQQIYGIASCCNVRVVTMEIVCPEGLAKERIAQRPSGDGLLSDPNDPDVYDKLKNDSDPVDVDFLHPGQDHVSYIQFDTKDQKILRKITGKGNKIFLDRIEKILKTN